MTKEQIEQIRELAKSHNFGGVPIPQLCDLAIRGLDHPEGRDISGLLHAAGNAEAKLRFMARTFMASEFTDRYGDGPVMLDIADKLKAELKRCAPMNKAQP